MEIVKQRLSSHLKNAFSNIIDCVFFFVGLNKKWIYKFARFVWFLFSFHIPIFVVCVVGSFFTVAGTVAVTTLVFSGCGNCGKWANCGCGAAFQYSVVVVVVTGLVVTSSLLFSNRILVFFSKLKYKRNETNRDLNVLVFENDLKFTSTHFISFFFDMLVSIWNYFDNYQLKLTHTSHLPDKYLLTNISFKTFFFSDNMWLAKSIFMCVCGVYLIQSMELG